MPKIQLIIPILLLLCLTAHTQNTSSSANITNAASNITAVAENVTNTAVANATNNLSTAAANMTNNLSTTAENVSSNATSNTTAPANVSSNQTTVNASSNSTAPVIATSNATASNVSSNASNNVSSNTSNSAAVQTLLAEITPIGFNIMTNATFELDNKTMDKGYPYLWPEPHSVNLTNNSMPLIISPSVFFNYNLTQIANQNSSDLATMNSWVSEVIFHYLEHIYEDTSLFTDFKMFQQDQQNQNTSMNMNATNSSMMLVINISNDTKGVFDFNTSEFYNLEISQDLITITADTYFGFVRAMETLSQTIIKVTPDEYNNLVQGLSYNDTLFANVSSNTGASANTSMNATSANATTNVTSDATANVSANASANSTTANTTAAPASNLSDVNTVNNDFLKSLQFLQPMDFNDSRFVKLNQFMQIEPAVVPQHMHIILNAPLTLQGAPAYPYRGVYLDSGRRFTPVAQILHTIDVLMYNKLNVLHWHLYDSESISFSSESNPKIGQFGAFSALEQYSQQDIQDILQYAVIRGVRVIPEISGISQSASLGKSPDFSDILACADQPANEFFKFCKYPPCGQLDPLNNKTYTVLGGLINDYNKTFTDGLIHMGEDDVTMECWNAKPSIASANMGLDALVNTFRTQELALLPAGKNGIFVWRDGQSFIQDGMIMQYKAQAKGMQDWLTAYPTNQVIFSPTDILQLDSGTGNFLGGPSTSGVYRTWLDIYNMDLNLTMAFDKQVLGGEIILWDSLTNYQNMDGKYWMRTAAMAERLWNPSLKEDEKLSSRVRRLVAQQDRLIQRGVDVTPITSRFCELNVEACFDYNPTYQLDAVQYQL